jgi:hypothetical protein
MEATERWQPLRARERPLREAGSIEERDCGEPEGIDPGRAKSSLGELNGETHGIRILRKKERGNRNLGVKEVRRDFKGNSWPEPDS